MAVQVLIGGEFERDRSQVGDDAADAEVTLLAHGSKCGRTSTVTIAPLTNLNRIITNPPLPQTECEQIEEPSVEREIPVRVLVQPIVVSSEISRDERIPPS
jgi:hypothetical protein